MREVTREDLAWIRDDTAIGPTIRSAVPGCFECYAVLDVDEDLDAAQDRGLAVLDALADGPEVPLIEGWIVKNSAWPPRPGDEHRLYADWPYRLRRSAVGTLRAEVAAPLFPFREAFPDLLFPDDRSWIVSTLWDDSWRSIGLDRRTARRLTARIAEVELIDAGTDLALTGREVR